MVDFTSRELIITQVNNKIAYTPFNKSSQENELRRRAINKQRVKVSGMCDFPKSSYSSKDITENYSV